jgi:hypothetical protein
MSHVTTVLLGVIDKELQKRYENISVSCRTVLCVLAIAAVRAIER